MRDVFFRFPRAKVRCSPAPQLRKMGGRGSALEAAGWRCPSPAGPFPQGAEDKTSQQMHFPVPVFPPPIGSTQARPTEPSHGCPPWHLGAPAPLGTSGVNCRWKTHALGLPQRPSPGVLPANIRGCWGRLWVFGYFGVLARWLAMEELSSWNARTAFLNSKMVMIHKGNC